MLFLMVFASSTAQASDLEVLINPDHADTPVDRSLLRTIFTMRTRTWTDGQPVRVFVMPDTNEIHDQFCRELLGIYPYVLRSAWDRMVFTGTGFAPEVVHSEIEMRAKVSTTPGAIGYARKIGRSTANGPAGLMKVSNHEK